MNYGWSGWFKHRTLRHSVSVMLLLVVCGLIYYSGELVKGGVTDGYGSGLYYTVHDMHRLLFLIPVLYAGFTLRIRGALIVSAITTFILLPRALILSPYPDPVLRMAVFIVIAASTGIVTGVLRNQVEASRHLLEIQKQLVHKLEASEHRYRDLFQKASDAIWITDMNGNIVSANNAALAFDGFKVEELSHIRKDTIVTSESLYKANEVRKNLLKNLTVEQPYEQRLITRMGQEITLMVTASLINSEGKPAGFEYIARDVTHERQEEARRLELEREVRAERDKLFDILDNMQDGVFITGKDYRIRFMNTTMIRWFGEGKDRYCYTHLAQSESPCRDICHLQTVVSGETTRWEYPRGEGKIFEVIASPFVDADGEICQLATLRNITQRKRLENELIKLNQLKSELLSNVSHELKTPLTSIKGIISSLLLKDIEWDSKTVEMLLNGMSEETDRLTSLVTNLLNMSKLESGIWQPELICCDIADTIIEAVESQKWMHRDRVYEDDISSDLLPVWADSNQIRQVINNLLENAVAYSADDTVIKIMAKNSNGVVQISVEDHGTGIPDSEIAQIFEKFYRGSYRRRSPGGTGLGLAISKAIIANHGGTIWVESESGHGSTFHFTLKLYET